MGDKQRNATVWGAAARWIIDNGGFVHPLLSYDEYNRQVSVKNASADDNADGRAVDEGEVLLQIPDSCLLSLYSIQNDVFGKSLFAAVHSLLPKSDGKTEPTSKRARSSEHNNKEEKGMYSDEQDVIIALFLAYLIEKKEKQKLPDECCTDASKPWLFFQPYLNTLPTSTAKTNDSITCRNEYSDLLPRQWPSEIIEKRLKGTSLYNRVLAEKNGLVDEYTAIKSTWQSENKSDSLSFPSLESYDMMMAAVSSRGFAGLGCSGLDVMVPILDLIDHVRGGSDHKDLSDMGHNGPKSADVRYNRYENRSGLSTVRSEASSVGEEVSDNTLKRKEPTIDDTQECCGGIMVTAARRLDPGAALFMTYGAKGNASLLGRYGFCIENNEEPDGSCNDILEIQLRPGTKPVRLQKGPKSYSYLPFVEALSMFRKDNTAPFDEEDKETYEGSNDVEADDLDAFLNTCDEESDCESIDCYNTATDNLTENAQSPNETRIADDMSAITSLISALENARSALETTNKLTAGTGMSTQERYCRILVQSEIKTILFFLSVCNEVKMRLAMITKSSVADSLRSHYLNVFENDVPEKAQEFIIDVTNAFVAIRY